MEIELEAPIKVELLPLDNIITQIAALRQKNPPGFSFTVVPSGVGYGKKKFRKV